MKKILLFLLLLNNAEARHSRPSWENGVGVCKESMPQYLARKALNRTDCEEIKDGIFPWIYYNRKPQYALKKNIDGEHFLPQSWSRDNCFYNRSFEEFKEAYNEEINLIATHHEENRDKSNWVCNKKGKRYDKFLNNITIEKQKEICKKQYEVCLYFNKEYNNACGNKCNELIYAN